MSTRHRCRVEYEKRGIVNAVVFLMQHSECWNVNACSTAGKGLASACFTNSLVFFYSIPTNQSQRVLKLNPEDRDAVGKDTFRDSDMSGEKKRFDLFF